MKDINELHKNNPTNFKVVMRDILANAIQWSSYETMRDLTLEYPPQNGGNEQWQPPIPLQEYDPPEFPVTVFCKALREFVVGLALETQTPVDLAANSVMSVLSAAVQGKVAVQANNNWLVPLSSYTATVLPSGSGKTPVHERVTKPIFDFEKQLREEMKEEVAESQSEQRRLERKIENAERQSVKAKDEVEEYEWREEAKQAAIDLDNLDVIYNPQLIADDITAEALAEVLQQQKERIFATASEGDIFNILGGRYGDGKPNFKIWLSGYDGSPMRINRKTSGAIFLDNPLISLGLTFQPGVLRDLRKTPQFEDQGLIPRLWLSIPNYKPGYRQANAPVMPHKIYANYANAITRLLTIKDQEV